MKNNILLEQLRRYGKEGLISLIDERRRTGKTLGQCFSLIGEAMKHGSVKITDYEPYHNLPEHSIRINVIPTILELIEKNNLKGLTINHFKMTLVYDHTVVWE